ncbi:MAG TPA: hypothetical protein VF651_09195 [Gammaproteobacteria bacterium]
MAPLVLCGCWNGKDQFRHYMEEGRAAHVPVVIYDISANDPRPGARQEPLAVAFLNTQDAELDSVTLTIAPCDTMGQPGRTRDVAFNGPFEPAAAVVISTAGSAGEDGKQVPVALPHMVITAVEVTDATGRRRFEGKDLAALLDERIANFCTGRAM